MADTIEKRVEDLEYILAHLPEDLDARFAGVHLRLAELREGHAAINTKLAEQSARLAEHTQRFSTLERRIAEQLSTVERQNAGRFSAIESKLDAVLAALARLTER